MKAYLHTHGDGQPAGRAAPTASLGGLGGHNMVHAMPNTGPAEHTQGSALDYVWWWWWCSSLYVHLEASRPAC